MKSLREIFRIGHGPSSSHTMGPYRASELIKAEFPDAAGFEVTLYGSLAATGKGHFTDKAILQVLPPEKTAIFWDAAHPLPQHPNGMKFRMLDAGGKVYAERTFFSIGGGAISPDGTAESTPEIYDFRNMAHVIEYCKHNSLTFWELVERCEGPEIWEYLGSVLDAMMRTVDNGLVKDGILPGELKLLRKGRSVYLKAKVLRGEIRRTALLAAYAYSAGEENASLEVVVTAPTCGSCGVLPAVLHYMKDVRTSRQQLLHALACAGLVGNVVKQNGSISGAEVGCQGEVGVACAMAAAAMAYLAGGTIHQIEYAAEIGLEHFLGLTCDPLCGQVQVPCIERNVVAANRAVVAAELALLSDGRHVVSFDAVVKTMLETGHDLPSLYRETSTGGLSKFALSDGVGGKNL